MSFVAARFFNGISTRTSLASVANDIFFFLMPPYPACQMKA